MVLFMMIQIKSQGEGSVDRRVFKICSKNCFNLQGRELTIECPNYIVTTMGRNSCG